MHRQTLNVSVQHIFSTSILPSLSTFADEEKTKNINATLGSITQAITDMGSAAGNWRTLIQKDVK